MAENRSRSARWLLAIGISLALIAVYAVVAVVVVAGALPYEFEQTAALIDAFWLMPLGLVGVALFVFGRRRGERRGGAAMRGFGIFLSLALLSPIPPAVIAVEILNARPASTVAATPTATIASPPPPTPSTTTTAYSKYWIPETSATHVWAVDALGYANNDGGRASPVPTSADLTLTAGLGKRVCAQLIYQTEVQVEASMRLELGIERWNSYGYFWFDSLVNGLCVRP